MSDMRARGAWRSGAALAAACVLFAATSLAAQGAGDRPLADVRMTSAGIDFVPLEAHGGAILKVSAGDVIHRYTFGPDESPWLSVFDAEGEPLADGVYSWELELLPPAEARADLIRSAAKNRGDAPEALTRQTGSFTLVGGYAVDPTLREPGAVGSARKGPVEIHHHEGSAGARGPQTDGDEAVLGGAVETRAPQPVAETARARPAGPDSDEMVAAGLSAERRDSNE